MFSPDLLIEIGPELLQYVRGHVHAQLHSQRCYRVVRGATILVIDVRNRYGGRVANHFRKIEIGSARVLMRPENLPHRVAKPCQTTSLTATKVARVLMQDRRENSLGHIIDRKSVVEGK